MRCSRATDPATANGSRRGAPPTRGGAGCARRRPRTPASNAPARRRPRSTGGVMSEDWPLYEVFIRSRSGLEHAHDVYTRRQEGVSIWVVRSADIIASDPEEADSLFEPARDKVYRHPTFYAIPEEVKNL